MAVHRANLNKRLIPLAPGAHDVACLPTAGRPGIRHGLRCDFLSPPAETVALRTSISRRTGSKGISLLNNHPELPELRHRRMPQALTTIMQSGSMRAGGRDCPVEHERRYRLSSCHAGMHGAVAGELAPLGGGPDRYRGNHGPRGRGRGRCLSASRDRFRPPRRDPVHGQGLFEHFSGGAVWLRHGRRRCASAFARRFRDGGRR